MRTRLFVRSMLLVCAVGMMLALPIVASAAPSTGVTGTVTAADTGLPLAGVRIDGYYRVGNSSWGFGTYYTDADGEYEAYFDPGQDATFFIRAYEPTSTYNGDGSDEITITTGVIKQVDFVLQRDSKAPQVAIYAEDADNYYYYSDVDAPASIARDLAAVPDDVVRWALVTNKSDDIFFQAGDEDYVNRYYWSWTNGCGLASLEHAVDGGSWTTRLPAEAVSVNWYDYGRLMYARWRLGTTADGLHTIRYRATDKNGNVSESKTALVIIDTKAPKTTYKSYGSYLKLTASDAVAGVLSTFARSSKPTFRATTRISVPESGSKTVYLYSMDKANNAEKIQKLKVSAPAKLSTPEPSVSSIASGKSFKVTGSVAGRSGASGYLKLYRWDGSSYKYVSKKAFTEGSNGKYSVSYKLDDGSYKFVATYGHFTSTWANPPVKSSMSDRVYVW